jgi:hypothetical protein
MGLTEGETGPAKRPWEQNRGDQDKYFNYGFNEESWKQHSKDVLSRTGAIEALGKMKDYQRELNNTLKKGSTAATNLNFYLPQQFGGLNDPCQPLNLRAAKTAEGSGEDKEETEKEEMIEIPSLSHLNLYTEDVDLP